MTEEQASLRVGAHVLVQLGSELVTDVEQAILECVKNAYDADSPGCRIVVDTRISGTLVETGTAGRLGRFDEPAENVSVRITDAKGAEVCVSNLLPETTITRTLSYTGAISVEDTGEGLDEAQLKSSWLVISGSKKRSADGPKAKTKGGRTPLGDKGVGRLGTMKLGDILKIESARSPTDLLSSAQFRWADCEVADTVDEIPVTVEETSNNARFKGTRVSVLGLRDMSEWRKPLRGASIARSLAQLISPFEATSTFPVSIIVDDVDYSLVAVTNELLSKAIATFEFNWIHNRADGKPELRAVARLQSRLLASKNNARQAQRTERVFEQDGGKAFLEVLPKLPRMRGYEEIISSPTGPWLIELHQTFTWPEIVVKRGEEVLDPGPFSGAFYYYNLTELETERAAALTGAHLSRDMVKEMAGINILRDGFRVRSPGDWLNVSSNMTSGSTYGLRVDNTLGYFSLTGEHNFKLTEKSDREGFVQDAYYRGFQAIAEACRKFSSDAMENTRRALDEYAKRLEPIKTASSHPLNPVTALQKTFDETKGARDLIDRQAQSLQADLKRLEQAPDGPEKAIGLATAAITAIEQIREKLTPTLNQNEELSKLEEVLDDQRDRMVSLFESAAVGLSARGLAHELRTHLAEIRQQTNLIQRSVEGGERALAPMLRAIRGSCSAIASAASLIDPMLPRSRTVKETLELEGFIKQYVAGRQTSFNRFNIRPVIAGSGNLTVRVNRGRLLQVIDNLTQNSIFWLRHGDETERILEAREIHYSITPTGFEVWDTGPGINKKVEASLFEIFVTMKPDAASGQGLGLFIVSQLLEIDGCSVSLGPERNQFGRLYKFVVDLSAVTVARGEQ